MVPVEFGDDGRQHFGRTNRVAAEMLDIGKLLDHLVNQPFVLEAQLVLQKSKVKVTQAIWALDQIERTNLDDISFVNAFEDLEQPQLGADGRALLDAEVQNLRQLPFQLLDCR